MKRTMRMTALGAGVLVVGSCGSNAPAQGGQDAAPATAQQGGQDAAPDASQEVTEAGIDQQGEASVTEALDAETEGSAPAEASAPRETGACHPIASAQPDEGAQHYAQLCSPTNYQTNPPSSGNHYSTWAAYKTYTTNFPAGFWVHNLEHGAIVITYNCPSGCADEVAQAQALIDSLPVDPSCDPAVKRRIIMLPDPSLTARFAASSWDFTLRADCFDRPAFTDFIATHYNHGREDICGNGVDPLTAVNGAPYCP